MKIMVLLFVLVLALIGEAAAGKTTTEANKVEETCNTFCLDKKELKEPTCKEACALNERFKTVTIDASTCSLECSDQHGSPAIKSCDEGCTKEYEAKSAEITASCDVVCGKVEKDPLGFEKCKEICSPALILKALEKAFQGALKH